MPDPLTNLEALEGSRRIEVRHDLEAAFWCRVFDVSPSELRHAVQQVGPQVAEVRRYLERRHPPPRVEDSGF
ncbi:MAG: DUF3606 domain-containing protein [Pseudomonadota bacterium]